MGHVSGGRYGILLQITVGTLQFCAFSVTGGHRVECRLIVTTPVTEPLQRDKWLVPKSLRPPTSNPILLDISLVWCMATIWKALGDVLFACWPIWGDPTFVIEDKENLLSRSPKGLPMVAEVTCGN